MPTTEEYQAMREEMLARIDIRAEMEMMGVEFVGTPAANGWFQCRNPYKRPDKNPSAAVYVGSDRKFRGYMMMFNTNPRTATSFWDFVRDWHPSLFGHDFRDIIDFYSKKTGVEISTVKKNSRPPTEKAVMFFMSDLTKSADIQKYLLEKRGINQQTIDKHKIGYSTKRKRISFPVYDVGGALANIRFHATQPGQKPKTVNWKGYGQKRLWGANRVAAAPKGSLVAITEGEFDAMVLEQNTGILSASPTNGTSAFDENWVKHFYGKHVVLVWDCDFVGRETATRTVGPMFERAVASRNILSLRIVRLFDGPEDKTRKDATDFFAKQGGTTEQFLEMLHNAGQGSQAHPPASPPNSEPGPSSGAQQTGAGPPAATTATKNLNTLPVPDPEIFFHGDDFLPVALANWFVGNLEIFNDGSTYYIYDSAHGIWQDRNTLEISNALKIALGHKAKTSRINDGENLVKMDTYKRPEEIEPNRMYINFKNGMLSLETGQLVPHDKKYNSRSQIPIDYDPTARCPRWLQFLKEIFADDFQKATTLQDFSGYCLYPGIFIHKCLFLVGDGANGKSVYMNTLMKIIGKENISSIELAQLDKMFLVGTIRNKLLNICTEIQTKKNVCTQTFKQLVAGDLVQGDEKYEKPYTFKPIAKHIFSMNETPSIADKTHGFIRRLIIVNFEQTFEGTDADPILEQKLEAELSGILNWCLVGLQRVLQKQRIFEPPKVVKAKEIFASRLNPVILFVEDRCELNNSSQNTYIRKDALYAAYSTYCQESGYKTLGKYKFYDNLCATFKKEISCQKVGGERCFVGIITK